MTRKDLEMLTSMFKAIALGYWDLLLGRPSNDYVYVNDDGTARELSPVEREYLGQKFHPGDSGRPYIKGFTANGTVGAVSPAFCHVIGYLRR
jgi:hypothetical protein